WRTGAACSGAAGAVVSMTYLPAKARPWKDEANPLGPPADPSTATDIDAAALTDLESRGEIGLESVANVAAKVGSDGTVGGSGGSPLSSTISQVGALPSASALPVNYPGVGNNVVAPVVGEFMVRGAMVHPGTGFTSGFSLSTLNTTLAQLVTSGLNTVRYLGSYVAYAANPTTYATNVGLALQAAVNHNLRFIYVFVAWFDDSPTSANLSLYTAYIDAILATGPSSNGNTWAGHPNVLGWEYLQEVPVANSLSGDALTLTQGLYTHMRSADPVSKLTGNPSNGNWGSNTPAQFGAAIAAWEPYVDFHSPHFYPDTSQTSTLNYTFSQDPLAPVRANTSKPIMMTEAGASTSSSDTHYVGTDERKAAFLAFVRRYLSGPSTMGLCYFPWQEVVSPHAMGLYSTSGTPSPALAEMQRFPTRSNAAAIDVMRRRSSPIVLDDFHRPNSASSVGTSPLGGTPTQVSL